MGLVLIGVIAWVAIGKPDTNEEVTPHYPTPSTQGIHGKDITVNFVVETNAVEKWAVLAATNLYVSVVPQATNAGTVTYQLLSSANAPAKTYTEAEINVMLDKTYRMGFVAGVRGLKLVELDEQATNFIQKAWDASTKGTLAK